MEFFLSGFVSGFTLGLAFYSLYLIILRNNEYNFKINIVKSLNNEILRTENKKIISKNIKLLEIIKINTNLDYLKKEINLIISLAQEKHISL